MLFKLFKDFKSCQSGNMGMMAAGASMVLILGVGLATDYTSATQEQHNLQYIADNAAIAAAANLPDFDAAIEAAKDVAEDYEDGILKLSDIVLTDTSATVNIKRQEGRDNAHKNAFMGVIGRHTQDINVMAKAEIGAAPGGGDAVCLLVLDPTDKDVFFTNHDAVFNAPSCNVHVNSNDIADGSVELLSSEPLIAKKLKMVGRKSTVSKSKVIGEEVTEDVDPIPDPYAAVPKPDTTIACGGVARVESDSTLNATQAFCNGLKIKAGVTATLEPGVYQIRGSKFQLENGATLQGDGVTLYIAEDGPKFDFDTNSIFDITAPMTGDHAGLAVWADASNDSNHDFDSEVTANAAGTLYFPNSQLTVNQNNHKWESNCVRFVVKEIEFHAGSYYRVEDPSGCPNNVVDPNDPVVGGDIRLVR